jgi:23S rRNA U2552 (ribose-2'-O)-methylase RlmE/FtsJ
VSGAPRFCSRRSRTRPERKTDGCAAATRPQRTHAPLEARPPCAQFARAGRCARGEACWFPHTLPLPAAPADAPALVLIAPRCRLARVAAAATRVLDAPCDTAAAVRADDARGCDFGLFVVRPCGGDVPAAAAALAADADLAGSLTRALWVLKREDGGIAAAAAAAATAAAALLAENGYDEATEACASPHVQLRVFPPWAAPALRDALRAAGVRCSEPGPPPALVLDASFAFGRWHWHVWRASAAPALLALRGRAAYAPPTPAAEQPGGASAVPSRALYKLDELLRGGALPLRAGALCADVGAAPGGWTARLSDELLALEAAQAQASGACVDDASAGHVWAIDPGALTLLPLPRNVTHLRLRGEAAAAPLTDALGGRLLDWVVCDANTHPPSAAALVLSLAPLMAADAGVVVSLKRFAQCRAAHEADVAAARGALASAGFAETRLVHLFANGADERTAVWRRAPPPGGKCEA